MHIQTTIMKFPYENLFLVNNISKIEGILQVRDIIKKYAFMDVIYMIEDMNLARKFSLKFILVHEAIEHAYSRTKPMEYESCKEERENDKHGEIWTFAFPEYDPTVKYSGSLGFEVVNGTLDMKAKNCYICGEYIYSATDFSNLTFCSCIRDDKY